MNNSEAKKIIENLTRMAIGSEDLFIPKLIKKAEAALERYEGDQSLMSFANFLNKRIEKSEFISRAELTDVGNKFYQATSKLGQVFQDELIQSPELHKNKVNNVPLSNDFLRTAMEGARNKTLDDAMSNIFEPAKERKAYSKELAKIASDACQMQLDLLGVEPNSLDVAAGQIGLLICRASYLTPKGTTSVLIPVKMNGREASLPTCFVSQAGLESLSKTAIETHIVSTAGKKFNVNAEQLLKLASFHLSNKPEIGDQELEDQIFKAKTAGFTEAVMGNGIYQEMHTLIPDIKLPTYKMAELEPFAEQLSKPQVSAEFVLGKKAVHDGLEMVKITLAKLGQPQAKIAVLDHDDKNIFCGIKIANQTCKIPVKVINKQAQWPELIISQTTGITELNRQNLQRVLAENTPDSEIITRFASCNSDKPSELIQRLKVAMKNSQYEHAEEIMEVLKASGDEMAYKTALSTMATLISNPNEVPESKCCMARKSASSIHMICGHTNLPVHKVYQDKYGACIPLYRKGMAEKQEGAIFVDSKIFL